MSFDLKLIGYVHYHAYLYSSYQVEFAIHSVILLPGKRPIVIARGGFTGMFPESSSFANQMTQTLSLPDTATLCNLQLTKDGIGICLSGVTLDNSTNINLIFPKDKKNYTVNGKEVSGWFSLDYTSDQLFSNVSCKSPNTLTFSYFLVW